MPSRRKSSPVLSKEEITVRELTKQDWPIVEELFGEKGACGGCWCMWWRVARGGKLWREVKGEKNRQDFRALVESGQVHGLLAFASARPVGWCCYGPRSTFPRLARSRVLQSDWSRGTWSIVCFYIAPGWRGRRVASRLLEAACARAFELGAKELEGYPVVPKTGPIPNAFAYTGLPGMFETAGFRELNREGASRPIYLRRKANQTTRSKKEKR
jgi:GNAT superfamily N-acetyltransferase